MLMAYYSHSRKGISLSGPVIPGASSKKGGKRGLQSERMEVER
jgi:hypothetical protein